MPIIDFRSAALAVSVAASNLLAAGCAVDGITSPPTVIEWPLLVKTVRTDLDAATISRHATQTARLPVTVTAPAGAEWYAATLRCGNETVCAKALHRLRIDVGFFSAVEHDGRREPQPAAPSQPASP
jgi:hypothetical protein